MLILSRKVGAKNTDMQISFEELVSVFISRLQVFVLTPRGFVFMFDKNRNARAGSRPLRLCTDSKQRWQLTKQGMTPTIQQVYLQFKCLCHDICSL